jgi:hypothetical protein
MSDPQHRRQDRRHHHPAVRKIGRRWAWSCDCGGASCRTGLVGLEWHHAVVEALHHSATIAA